MKKIFLSSLVGFSILFSGCGVNQGVGMGDYRQDVKHQFITGKVVSSKKVLVSKDKIALVRGLAIGAGTGAVIGSFESGAGAIQGGIIGGVIGAISGLASGYIIDGNEEEAYELTIRVGITEYLAYTKEDISLGSSLEFVVREDNAITNISIQKEIPKD